MGDGQTLWTGIARCRDYGAELNRALHVPTAKKSDCEMAAPLVAICKIPGHSTAPDINFRYDIEWTEEITA